jgi:hypothetical protein
VQIVARDVGGGQKEADIKNYAKVEKIPGGTIEDCKVRGCCQGWLLSGSAVCSSPCVKQVGACEEVGVRVWANMPHRADAAWRAAVWPPAAAAGTGQRAMLRCSALQNKQATRAPLNHTPGAPSSRPPHTAGHAAHTCAGVAFPKCHSLLVGGARAASPCGHCGCVLCAVTADKRPPLTLL